MRACRTARGMGVVREESCCAEADPGVARLIGQCDEVRFADIAERAARDGGTCSASEIPEVERNPLLLTGGGRFSCAARTGLSEVDAVRPFAAAAGLEVIRCGSLPLFATGVANAFDLRGVVEVGQCAAAGRSPRNRTDPVPGEPSVHRSDLDSQIGGDVVTVPPLLIHGASSYGSDHGLVSSIVPSPLPAGAGRKSCIGPLFPGWWHHVGALFSAGRARPRRTHRRSPGLRETPGVLPGSGRGGSAKSADSSAFSTRDAQEQKVPRSWVERK